jgi:cyclopropane-fatty-acyl-phospholipid synthase
VLRLLRHLSLGSLSVQWPDGSVGHFGPGGEPRAALRVDDWACCRAVLTSGDIGFAEGYLAGRWSSPDLAALLRLMLLNREQVERLIYGSWWGSLAYRMRHLLNRNTRAGSRRNIHAHYDLGNAFYGLWLDETMNYSSAWFQGNLSGDLAQAQQAKMARALDAAGVQAGDTVLEIGCGWGALAQAAAQQGAEVVGLTLSSEQLAWGRRRLASAGMAGSADLRLQDWRELGPGQYDAIVSIEMFEAVGRPWWPAYFAQLARSLKRGGRACIQTITIRDDLFNRYARSTDFIQQYIFPGGMLPSDAQFRAAAGAAGLVVEEGFGFGADYAETLRRWRSRFVDESAAVQGLGFDARFLRLWEFYLAYCEAAFDTGNTDVVQYRLRHA